MPLLRLWSQGKEEYLEVVRSKGEALAHAYLAAKGKGKKGMGKDAVGGLPAIKDAPREAESELVEPVRTKKLKKLKSKMKVEPGEPEDSVKKSTPKMRRLRKLHTQDALGTDGEPREEEPAEAQVEKDDKKKTKGKMMTGKVDVSKPFVRLRTKTSSDSLDPDMRTPTPKRSSHTPRAKTTRSPSTAGQDKPSPPLLGFMLGFVCGGVLLSVSY